MSTLEIVFDRILDVTSVFSIPSFSLTIFVIIKATPKKMKSFSHPLLNIFLWNAVVNFLFIFARPFPMMPLACFKLNGFLGAWTDNEILGQGALMITLLVMVNVAVGLFISFHLRYMAIAHSSFISKLNSRWLWLYGAILHGAFSAGYLWAYSEWTLTVDHYPYRLGLKSRRNLFCLAPDGPHSRVCILYLFFFIAFIVTSMIVFVSLSFYQLYKTRSIVSPKTAKMQKTLLWNLICLSAIPIIFGGLPYLMFSFVIFFHDWPHAQVVATVCTLMMIIYGPTMCVSCLLLFKIYRNAVRDFFRRSVGRATNVTPVITMMKSSL